MNQPVPESSDDLEKSENKGLSFALDFGPLLVFFLVNWFTPEPKLLKIMAATSAFMVAMIVAIIISYVKLGKISPMLWVSGGLVTFFGAATLWFQDETFIQIKPTIVYMIFATVLIFGMWTGRSLLKALLGTAYPGLSDEGYRKLTISWTMFFVAAAILNELVWRNQSWDFWVGFKLWGMLPLTFAFAIANVPMLMRHGLDLGQEEDAADQSDKQSDSGK
ncbi:septation protein A [Parasphingorhabdus sp.]|uniref:septation protein A n=1 Tax=Parasphingorhabdus sp. TaxID=2709688 RepID=UPI0032671682